MLRILIFSLLTIHLVQAQDSLDYELYSLVVQEKLDFWDEGRDSLQEVIFIRKAKPWSHLLIDYIPIPEEQELNSPFMHPFYSSYFGFPLDTLNSKDFKDLSQILTNLSENFYKTPRVKKEKFNLHIPVSTISEFRFKRFFQKWFFKGNVREGWKKFRLKFPNTLGIFRVSKVEYEGKYAAFYFAHLGGALFGGGSIVILKKEKDNWRILRYAQLWVS